MKELLQTRGIKLINHPLSLDNLHQQRLFLDALHPTPEGNRIMAKSVLKFIDKI
jgi:phospholipase/lecithinase/hemolysin